MSNGAAARRDGNAGRGPSPVTPKSHRGRINAPASAPQRPSPPGSRTLADFGMVSCAAVIESTWSTVGGHCPFTGPSCTLPCIGGTPSEPAACGLDFYCHSDGTVYGLATRNALLYRGSPRDTDAEVESAFEAWIVEHEAELGLDPGLERAHLGLNRVPGVRSPEGPLTIQRFSQTYRGFPVLAPDGVVTLVYGPEGAISVSGAIIDNRTPYTHEAMQASATKAELSILRHAGVSAAIPRHRSPASPWSGRQAWFRWMPRRPRCSTPCG
jgi:hypothetical protein